MVKAMKKSTSLASTGAMGKTSRGKYTLVNMPELPTKLPVAAVNEAAK